MIPYAIPRKAFTQLLDIKEKFNIKTFPPSFHAIVLPLMIMIEDRVCCCYYSITVAGVRCAGTESNEAINFKTEDEEA